MDAATMMDATASSNGNGVQSQNGTDLHPPPAEITAALHLLTVGNHPSMDMLSTPAHPPGTAPAAPTTEPDIVPRLSFQDPEDNLLNRSFSSEDEEKKLEEEEELAGEMGGGERIFPDGLLWSKPKKKKELPLIVHGAKNGNGTMKNGSGSAEKVFGQSGVGDRMDAFPIVHPRTGVPLAPAPKDLLSSYRYSMDNMRRGMAIIINNQHFTMANTPSRKGSDNDARMLEATLKRLDFEVAVFTDLSVRVMQDCFRYYSNQDHTNYDCFFCAVFTHGEEQGIIYGTDGKLNLSELTIQFRGDKCTTLAGKPKIFVVQACRGDRLDAGVDLIEADAPSTFRIPAEADFLYAFSTVPGYFSWRNTELGSWFIQALCHMLDQHALDPDMDILKLLTRVSHQVAFGHESNVPSDTKWHRKKQIPSIVSMLTKDVVFTRKTK
ncbi:caspase-3-like isoform X2 [Paramacrobiotus metropolitanus]|uniref:caspase-3-like isoform X2 n=1 Tax=Paramacrobiotus metropolitanus TaxID=2943436 RepID=UPI002445B00A|nr:caspase-3-like isoform X2 [Paramacrobiotus metropolitanus]